MLLPAFSAEFAEGNYSEEKKRKKQYEKQQEIQDCSEIRAQRHTFSDSPPKLTGSFPMEKARMCLTLQSYTYVPENKFHETKCLRLSRRT